MHARENSQLTKQSFVGFMLHLVSYHAGLLSREKFGGRMTSPHNIYPRNIYPRMPIQARSTADTGTERPIRASCKLQCVCVCCGGVNRLNANGNKLKATSDAGAGTACKESFASFLLPHLEKCAGFFPKKKNARTTSPAVIAPHSFMHLLILTNLAYLARYLVLVDTGSNRSTVKSFVMVTHDKNFQQPYPTRD